MTPDERGPATAVGDRGEMDGDARVLEIDGVSKRYGDLVALENLTFDVRAGELFGFVGRNGAGKTTTMRIVLGVLSADAGTVRWGGAPLDFATRRRFGYMPEERGLYPKMRLLEQLVYLGTRPAWPVPMRGARPWTGSSGSASRTAGTTSSRR